MAEEEGRQRPSHHVTHRQVKQGKHKDNRDDQMVLHRFHLFFHRILCCRRFNGSCRSAMFFRVISRLFHSLHNRFTAELIFIKADRHLIG